MLVLSRRKGEAVVIGGELRVQVLEVSGSRVKLGFSGPPEVSIHREELYAAIAAETASPSVDLGRATCECR